MHVVAVVLLSFRMRRAKSHAIYLCDGGVDFTSRLCINLLFVCFFSLRVCFIGNLSQIETLVLNVSGRILMVNKENNGNASENLVSLICDVRFSFLF